MWKDRDAGEQFMKVDFIICTNSELWYNECIKYIENLIIPADVEVSVLGITEAMGMAEGYEQGRNRSKADYKIYLHQDVFIVNRHFIEDIDRVFRADDRIGIIGVLGNDDIADQSFSWGKWKWGKVIAGNGTRQLLMDCGEITGEYREVDCLDGMILVTRYDVPWRKDIFTGWHFYDRSICGEYRRRGYLCVVPRQDIPWCIHACGVSELNGWNENLAVYLNEYRDFFQTDSVSGNIELPDQNELRRSLLAAEKLESLVDQRKMAEAASLLDEVFREGSKLNKRLVFCRTLLEIWRTGEFNLFFAEGDNVTDMRAKYERAYFLLQRKYYGIMLDVEDVIFLSGLTEQERAAVMRHELTLHDLVERDAAEVTGILEQAVQRGHMLLENLGAESVQMATSGAVILAVMLDAVECVVPASIYGKYRKFLTAFNVFCRRCGNESFLLHNKDELISSLELFEECMADMMARSD